MDAPVIGISMASLLAIEGVSAPQPPSSVVGARYVEALEAAGAVPWPIPVLGSESVLLRSLYARLDGILLPGGADIRPSEYRTDPHPSLDRGDPLRDQTERTLARWASQDGTPILGICRGMQLLNVLRGGSLTQDLSAQVLGVGKHDYVSRRTYPRDLLAHEVRITPETRTHALLGATHLRVNSLHHQAVSVLGHGLVASAFAPDGVIEALECPDHPFLVGVQWHPEEIRDQPAMSRLFEGLVESARLRSERGAPAHLPRIAAVG